MIFDSIKNLAIAIGIVILIPFTVYNGYDLSYSLLVKAKEQQSLENKSEAEQKPIRRKNTQHYDRLYFYTASVCAALFIMLGLATKIDFLGGGFILGGIITLITGIMRYWLYYGQAAKFFVLFSVLILLTVSAYFLGNRSERKG